MGRKVVTRFLADTRPTSPALQGMFPQLAGTRTEPVNRDVECITVSVIGYAAYVRRDSAALYLLLCLYQRKLL